MRIAIPLSKLRVAPDGSHPTLHSPANAHPLKVVTGKRNLLIPDFGDAHPKPAIAHARGERQPGALRVHNCRFPRPGCLLVCLEKEVIRGVRNELRLTDRASGSRGSPTVGV